MSSKNERICRLCLKVAKNEFQEIIGVVKQILGVLLLRLDLDVTRNPIICEDCMEVAKKCLDFKSTCIDTEKIIVLFSADKKKTRHRIRDIYEEKVKIMTVMDERLDICRFCFTLLERNNCMSMDSLMDETMFEMFSEYLPETDLNVIENPIICRICRENLDSYFMFVTNCVDIEAKITAYCKNTGTYSTCEVTLSNILQDPAKCYRTYKVKKEPNAFENTDLVRHEPHNELMKLEEELDIKEGIHFSENPSERPLHKYEDTFRSNQHDEDTKPDIFYLKTSEDKTEERTFQKQAPVKTEDISSRVVFNVNRSESTDMPIDRRIVCLDGAQLKMRVKQKWSNLVTNRDASEENLYRYTLHKSIHKDISEIKMYKCSLCTCKFKNNTYLMRHMLVHKNVSEVKMFKCSLCTFQTKHQSSLRNHMPIHKDISEIKTYKCSLCTYECKKKASLIPHMLVHKDVSEVKMLKCSLCSFESKYKNSLKMHMLIHSDVSKIKMYKCSLCTFQTKHQSSLNNRHMSVHNDISETKAYKCALCTCEYKRKSYLIRHMRIHRDGSKVKK